MKPVPAWERAAGAFLGGYSLGCGLCNSDRLWASLVGVLWGVCLVRGVGRRGVDGVDGEASVKQGARGTWTATR